jgi:hypothetical protein
MLFDFIRLSRPDIHFSISCTSTVVTYPEYQVPGTVPGTYRIPVLVDYQSVVILQASSPMRVPYTVPGTIPVPGTRDPVRYSIQRDSHSLPPDITKLRLDY